MTLLLALDILIKALLFMVICLSVTSLLLAFSIAWNWVFDKQCLCGTITLPSKTKHYNLGMVTHTRMACWPTRETIQHNGGPFDYEDELEW